MSADDDIVRPFGWNLDPDDLATEKVDDEAVFATIAKLTMAQYERRREEFADLLGGIRVAELDKEVKRRRKEITDGGSGKAVELYEPEPWPDPVDGATLADDIAAAIHRTVVLAPESADTAALLDDLHPRSRRCLVLADPRHRLAEPGMREDDAALDRRPDGAEAALGEQHHRALPSSGRSSAGNRPSWSTKPTASSPTTRNCAAF